MKKKIREASRYWNEESESWQNYLRSEEIFNFEEFDSLQKFTGTHPAVLKNRIEKQYWDFVFDITRKKFSLKDKLLYSFEKRTGMRLFVYKNYKII